MHGDASLDDYRDVIAKARTLVVTWRDVDVRAGGRASAADIEWFDRWRDDAIGKYNSLAQHLAVPDPDHVKLALSMLVSESRAMSENIDWERLAPSAVGPFVDFMHANRALSPRIPDDGTPEAVRAEPLYRILAGEFRPVRPRLGHR